MKNIIKYKLLLALMFIASLAVISSCDDEEGSSGEIQLHSFGPSPAMRGGKLKFIGNNLDKVTAIILPDNIEVTSFVTKSSKLVEIDIPEATVEGKVVLKTPQGDITTKSALGIAEPITIASMKPATVRPGNELTIEGTYLNLVKEVIFKDNKSVTEFVSQSQTSLTVVVPEDAQTGIIVLSDGQSIPNLIESEEELVVKLPAVTELTPATIRAGDILSLVGSDLDLVRNITFNEGLLVGDTSFVSQSASQIEVKVPASAKDGALIIRPASGIDVPTPVLTMVVPAITSFSPTTGKNNENITITGTNLDLVTSVTFGGGANGEIQTGGTATSITVKVPPTAVEGSITLNTGSGKSVSTETELELVVPTITSFTPTSVNTEDDPVITITGTDLDLVDTVIFAGGWKGIVTDATETEIEIAVVPGSVSGKIELVTTNNTRVQSASELTIVPDVPNITGLPLPAKSGDKITFTGTNMNVPAVVYFPSEKAGEYIVATQFGVKDATTLEVYIPTGVAGHDSVRLKFVTHKNEVYLSPEFTILSSLPVLVKVFYDDAIKSGFQQWGTKTVWNSTEQVRSGTSAIKMDLVSGDWSVAGQFGGASVSTEGTTEFVFSAYGGPGSAGQKLQLLVKRPEGAGTAESTVQVDLVEGAWTDYRIPLSSLGNPTAITEFFFQDPPGLDADVYIDHVGLK